jgi:tetratricopeptide (TPR) repeat protein
MSRLATLLLVASTGLVPAARGAPAVDADLTQLERAVAAHPDDPDLLWALAMALDRHGRSAQAAERLQAFAARWPERRPDLYVELGRVQYRAGGATDALASLERALEHDPTSATAHFYRGLALRRLGRLDQAERGLRTAARLEPALRPETLLFRGLGELDRGRHRAARHLLDEAASLDGSGDIARLARVALLELDGPRQRALTLRASAGIEADSNVTLESEHRLPGATSNASDVGASLSAGFVWQPLRTESSALSFGYRFGQGLHADRDEFDYQTHLGHVSASWRAGERVTLRTDGLYSASHLDGERYAHSLSAQPSLVVALGPRLGALRLHAEATRRSYFEDPLFTSLDRDATTFGGGLTHFAAIPGRPGAWGSASIGFAKTRTDAGRDPLGFRGDYDHVTWRAGASAHTPLVRDLALNASLQLTRDRYLHHNLIDALTDGGVGTPDPDRRRDTVLQLRLAVERPLTRHVDLELAWRFTRQISNVDAFDYDRHVLGLYLKTQI